MRRTPPFPARAGRPMLKGKPPPLEAACESNSDLKKTVLHSPGQSPWTQLFFLPVCSVRTKSGSVWIKRKRAFLLPPYIFTFGELLH